MRKRKSWKATQKILGLLGLCTCGGSLALGIGDPLIIMLPLSLGLLFSKTKIIY